jgi:hypothetical protein
MPVPPTRPHADEMKSLDEKRAVNIDQGHWLAWRMETMSRITMCQDIE